MEGGSDRVSRPRTTGGGGFPGAAWPWVRALALAALAALWLSACGTFVKTSGEVMPVQEKAPLFALPDQNGQEVSLQGMLDQGPVLIVFYRGHW